MPSQIIAELFKVTGYDGVAYRSALGDGHNVALFDLDAASPINFCLYSVASIRPVFEQASNVYRSATNDTPKSE